MSVPMSCGKCQAIVGVEPEFSTIRRAIAGCFEAPVPDIPCPGEGNHPKPKRLEIKQFFGLISKVYQIYPETHTVSSWNKYVGPANKLLLRLAITFGTKRYPNGSYEGVVVNGKWAWWDSKYGLFGDGVEELCRLAA